MSSSRAIVITGVAKGLGRAMTEKFISLGHRVAGCSQNVSAVEHLQETFPGHHFSIVDVADEARVSRWAERVLKEFGTPDLLINNAAIINRSARLWTIPVGEVDRLFDVNIKGVNNVLHHFIPSMIREGGGVIVNFSSGWGRSVSAEVASYCASKWAIEGLTKALAEELPDVFAAVPLNPGVINTEMLQSCFGGDAASFPDPAQWAEHAVPFILGLSAKDNGRSLSVG